MVIILARSLLVYVGVVSTQKRGSVDPEQTGFEAAETIEKTDGHAVIVLTSFHTVAE